jgi:hypothetical protein
MTAFNHVVDFPFGGVFFGFRRPGVFDERLMGCVIITCSVFLDSFVEFFLDS